MQARNVQHERFKGHVGIYCNAQRSSKMLHIFAEPDEAGLHLLNQAMTRFDLSARAYEKILKVARTIADLDHSGQVLSKHISEAIGYRNLDRSSWGE